MKTVLLYLVVIFAIIVLICLPNKMERKVPASSEGAVFTNNVLVFKDEEAKQRFEQTKKLYKEDNSQVLINKTLVFDESRSWPKLTDEIVDRQLFYGEQKIEEPKQMYEVYGWEDVKLFPSLSDIISFDNDEQFEMVEALGAQYEKLLTSENDISVTIGTNIVFKQVPDDLTISTTTVYRNTYVVGDDFFDTLKKLLKIVESETEDQKNRDQAIDEAKIILKNYGK